MGLPPLMMREQAEELAGKYCTTALGNIYAELCILDYAKGAYRTLRGVPDGLFPAEPSSGGWDALLDFALGRAHPDDRNGLREFLCPQSPVYDAREIRLRAAGKDGWRWVSARSLALDETATWPRLYCARTISGLSEWENRRDRKQSFLDQVVRASYDEIYEFDLLRGLCHILHNGSAGYIPPETRNLEEIVIEAERDRVHPDDIPLYRETFSPAAILRRFSAGEREITAEYRRKTADGSYRWFSMCMKPILYPEDDLLPGSLTIVLFKDIDRRRRAEESARRLQTKYFLAMRTACGHFCDVDVSTGRYALTVTGDELLKQAPAEGNYMDFLDWMSAHAIHPEDAAAWRETMLPERLEAAKSAGRRRVFVDYRYGDGSGEWKWRCGNAVWLTGGPGERDSVLLFAQDISQRKKADQLALSNRLLRQEIEHQKNNAALDACYRIIVKNTGAEIFEWNHGSNPPPSAHADPNAILSAGQFINSPRIMETFHLEDKNCDLIATLLEKGLIHPEDAGRLRNFRMSAGSLHREITCRVMADGDYLWYKFTVNALVKDGFVEHVVGTALDVDREIRTKRALELSNMRYRTVLRQTDTIEFEYDAVTKHSYISPVLWERYEAELPKPGIQRDIVDLLYVHPEDMEEVRRSVERCRQEKPEKCDLQCRILEKTGNYVWCRFILDLFRDEDGRITRILGTLHNVDRETRAYQELRYKAERDSLTGIWNQDTFFKAVNRLLEEPDRGKTAMIMMDIDKFKVVNEIFGMEGGNNALALVGQVLRRILGTNGYYARMYADVFCMAVPYQTDDDLISLMVRIINTLSSRDYDYMLVPCFGICRIPDGPIGSTKLVEMAGYAHKAVKAAAGRQWAFYDETMRSNVIEQKQIESEMEHALRSGQFQVYLQPKYSLPGQKVEGAEALVRWIHPQKGLIPPGKFIPLFEENGFIMHLDYFVWEETCKLIRKWIDEGKDPFPISVNVSRMHIYDQNLQETLIRLTEKYNIPRELFELELTETMFPDNTQALLSMMHGLQESGFVLAMDDFGSGYSSLNMLKDMPLDVLKIDCEFFGETEEEKRGRTVVRHTVAMAHALEMRVVAEGVETESEADFLSETGCDTAQGFYFARPIPIKEFERLAFPSPS